MKKLIPLMILMSTLFINTAHAQTAQCDRLKQIEMRVSNMLSDAQWKVTTTVPSNKHSANLVVIQLSEQLLMIQLKMAEFGCR